MYSIIRSNHNKCVLKMDLEINIIRHFLVGTLVPKKGKVGEKKKKLIRMGRRIIICTSLHSFYD
jgi:hypothetical protein